MYSKKILFVCLGNICRSPMAEGVFLHLLNEMGIGDKYTVDSAGTAGYHIGASPDKRMVATALSHGVTLPSKTRKCTEQDFLQYDYIVAMDQSNVDDLTTIKPTNNVRAQLLKMRDFDIIDKHGDVPDPYYGGQEGFENVYQILLRCNTSFIDYLEKNK